MWEQFSKLLGGLFGGSDEGVQQTERPAYTGGNPYSTQASGFGSTLGGNAYQAPPTDWWSRKGAFGTKDEGGWAMPALTGLQSMMQWSQGNKALDLAKDQFNLSKEMAQKNLANQTSLLNTAMRDRQNARRSASSSVQDTDSYMANNGI